MVRTPVAPRRDGRERQHGPVVLDPRGRKGSSGDDRRDQSSTSRTSRTSSRRGSPPPAPLASHPHPPPVHPPASNRLDKHVVPPREPRHDQRLRPLIVLDILQLLTGERPPGKHRTFVLARPRRYGTLGVVVDPEGTSPLTDDEFRSPESTFRSERITKSRCKLRWYLTRACHEPPR